MAATAEQVRIAETIEMHMRQLLGAGCNDVEIMAAMYDHMPSFIKGLMDTKPSDEVLDELFERFPSFLRYTKILENMAEALQAGAFADLGFGKRPSNDDIH
jgi:hypothetical protein